MQLILIWLLLMGFLTTSGLTPAEPPGCEVDIAKPYLVAEDNQPLGDRIPLILIHGWLGECSGGEQGWENVIATIKHRGFALFKVYRFIYPSRRLSLEQAGRALKGAIAARPELDGRRLLLIGHSRGGLVARTYMEFDGGGERTIKLITLATPHHGSPLASLLALVDGQLGNGRVREDLKRIFGLSRYSDLLLVGAKLTVSFGYRLIYGIAPQSFLDMRWDDYDGLVQQDYARYSARVKEELDNLFLQKLNSIPRFDHKIIAYYGYLSPTARALGWGDPQRVFYRLSGELERTLPGDFCWNDGLIPIQSASFAGHKVTRRGPFSSMNHVDIRDHPQVLRRLMKDLRGIAQEEGLRGRDSPQEAAVRACGLLGGEPLRLCAD